MTLTAGSILAEKKDTEDNVRDKILSIAKDDNIDKSIKEDLLIRSSKIEKKIQWIYKANEHLDSVSYLHILTGIFGIVLLFLASYRGYMQSVKEDFAVLGIFSISIIISCFLSIFRVSQKIIDDEHHRFVLILCYEIASLIVACGFYRTFIQSYNDLQQFKLLFLSLSAFTLLLPFIITLK